MQKLEYTNIQKKIYKCEKTTPFFIDVPDQNYLVFDGSGHPNGEDYQKSCETVFTISYILKFKIARELYGIDYKVNPMEVSWNLEKSACKIDFTWTMSIMQPNFITEADVQQAINIAHSTGKNLAFDRLRFELISYGKSIQCFHKGDYNLMNDTLAKMKSFAATNNVTCDNYTHDIYLNDMRKTKMENYKSIMRVRYQ